MIELRPYQEECVEAVLRRAEAGVLRQLVSLPTGAGKTLVAASIARRLAARTLFLVHRDELCAQTEEKFGVVWPEASVGVVKAERNELGRDVTIASIQTLLSPARRAQLPPGFGLVIVDEAHHYVSRRWEAVVELYGEDGLTVGITATARRSDKRALGRIFDEVVYHRPMLELIEAGYLADLTGIEVRTGVNLDGVPTADGDFAERALDAVINVDNRNRLIAEAWLKYARGRKTVCFTASVGHAHLLAQAMKELGIRAAAIDGSMPLPRRRFLLKLFREGELDVLSNCNVLSEGFDQPDIGCIVMARPTKSEPYFAQAIGRGARSFPGKQNCLIIDVADNAGRHSLMSLPTLLGIDRDVLEQAGGLRAAVQRQERAAQQVRPTRVGHGTVGAPVNLFSQSNLTWTPAEGRGWCLFLGDQGRLSVVPAEDGTGYQVWHQQGSQRQLLYPRPIPVDWAIGIAEEKARQMLGAQTNLIRRDAAWRGKPITPKQVELLQKFKLPSWRYARLTAGEASDLINSIIAERGTTQWWQRTRGSTAKNARPESSGSPATPSGGGKHPARRPPSSASAGHQPMRSAASRRKA